MPDNGSVTGWLAALRNGESIAAQKCWEAYYSRLVNLARVKLSDKKRTLQGPEDVALSALKSFCLGAEQGRFPRLDDRHDLWQILVMLTKRKAIDALRRESCRPDLVPLPRPHVENSTGGLSIDDIIADEPTPQSIVALAEERQRLLAMLPDDLCRQVAELKLQNYTNVEIAAKLDRSVATIERKLDLTRRHWEKAHE